MIRKIKYTAFAAALFFASCTEKLTETNENPNSPVTVPTTTLLINAQYRLVDDIRDQWYSGRMALVWSQYWAQANYTEEDRYQYRENSNSSSWKVIYTDLMDLKTIADLNTDPATKDMMSAYGNNNNQIAVARILKSWTFMLLTETYGPIPYESYGNDNPSFQALKAKENILNPVYADPKDVYTDILKELREAADMIDVSEVAFTEGDRIFGGDASKWKKLANSLILRGALRIKAAVPEIANLAITAALHSGIMDSDTDNALFRGEATAANASPFYKAFAVDNRTDFTVAKPFVDLLKANVGPFASIDPRLYYFAAPFDATATASAGPAISKGDYLPKASDILGTGKYNPDNYIGMPYGLESEYASKIGATKVSLPNMPMQATFGNPFMDYAEVCFIQSELNGWNQEWYEKGVRASMIRWGVNAASIDTYMATLPAASEETVLTQKYIALYMQPYNAWAEYRRTGYPKTLVKPGDVSFVDTDGIISKDDAGKEYVFTTLVSDVTDDLPSRVKFANDEPLLNPSGYDSGVVELGGSDKMSTKLWWDVN
ncbi:SusD/RagB family nutrient-binding outer membrane lipoprotein [Halosquirtibacter xylanolyticus]|uniref:SusD/RagB family nutrient-binding outer membrane lipoprotein n=1 Tax=Halosquirtibacter xylanolyticus TaxID=3374599 RepID=UPI0037478E45|nr:SusD/RagB family nutrient-binding outer membrane lipoprotein [Prolixibacteraceae bacterium]